MVGRKRSITGLGTLDVMESGLPIEAGRVDQTAIRGQPDAPDIGQDGALRRDTVGGTKPDDNVERGHRPQRQPEWIPGQQPGNVVD